jgi:hypothetical protein
MTEKFSVFVDDKPVSLCLYLTAWNMWSSASKKGTMRGIQVLLAVMLLAIAVGLGLGLI